MPRAACACFVVISLSDAETEITNIDVPFRGISPTLVMRILQTLYGEFGS
jgi:hypothetical protein